MDAKARPLPPAGRRDRSRRPIAPRSADAPERRGRGVAERRARTAREHGGHPAPVPGSGRGGRRRRPRGGPGAGARRRRGRRSRRRRVPRRRQLTRRDDAVLPRRERRNPPIQRASGEFDRTVRSNSPPSIARSRAEHARVARACGRANLQRLAPPSLRGGRVDVEPDVVDRRALAEDGEDGVEVAACGVVGEALEVGAEVDRPQVLARVVGSDGASASQQRTSPKPAAARRRSVSSGVAKFHGPRQPSKCGAERRARPRPGGRRRGPMRCCRRRRTGRRGGRPARSARAARRTARRGRRSSGTSRSRRRRRRSSPPRSRPTRSATRRSTRRRGARAPPRSSTPTRRRRSRGRGDALDQQLREAAGAAARVEDGLVAAQLEAVHDLAAERAPSAWRAGRTRRRPSYVSRAWPYVIAYDCMSLRLVAPESRVIRPPSPEKNDGRPPLGFAACGTGRSGRPRAGIDSVRTAPPPARPLRAAGKAAPPRAAPRAAGKAARRRRSTRGGDSGSPTGTSAAGTSPVGSAASSAVPPSGQSLSHPSAGSGAGSGAASGPARPRCGRPGAPRAAAGLRAARATGRPGPRRASPRPEAPRSRSRPPRPRPPPRRPPHPRHRTPPV